VSAGRNPTPFRRQNPPATAFDHRSLHHRELHRSRNEPLWWKTARIDPIQMARELWGATRPKAAPQPVTPDSVLPALPLSADETSKASAVKRRAAPDAAAKSSGP
jgi:hypothetical protein